MAEQAVAPIYLYLAVVVVSVDLEEVVVAPDLWRQALAMDMVDQVDLVLAVVAVLKAAETTQADWADRALGAVLLQEEEGEALERVLAVRFLLQDLLRFKVESSHLVARSFLVH